MARNNYGRVKIIEKLWFIDVFIVDDSRFLSGGVAHVVEIVEFHDASLVVGTGGPSTTVVPHHAHQETANQHRRYRHQPQEQPLAEPRRP